MHKLAMGLAYVLMVGKVAAGLPGEIEPVGGPNEYRVTLKNGQLANVAGSLYRQTFDLGTSYSANVFCGRARETVTTPFFYRATTNLPLSDINGWDDYHQLNDYIDVKIEIYIAGQLRENRVVPFLEVSNGTAPERVRINCNAASPPTGVFNDFRSGSRGQVTFKLRKPIVNGISINSRHIVDVYGRLRVDGGTASFGGVPMSRVVIETALLVVSDRCSVNNGEPISVDFGNVPQAALTGNQNVRHIPVRYTCSGGSFTTGVRGISIGVSARPAEFSNNYIATTTDGLGVVLKHQGEVVKPNQFYKMPRGQTNEGSWDLTAAPISMNDGFSLGDFHANGTIVMEFSE